MLPFAIQVGIGAVDYWSMSYGEITDTIDAFRVMEERKLKEQAGLNYSLANLIGLSVARLTDSKAEYPTLKQAYPTLFGEDELEEVPEVQDWRVAKERMMQYTTATNKKFKKEGDTK